MNVKPTKLAEVVVLEPQVLSDDRGFFLETWNSARYDSAGIQGPFAQDNISFSKRGVL
ncbi:MAG: dTDP-4-dehydrorhamnose 3,5-epimerase family protein, partial [Planctomycetota bacterium]